MEKTNYKELREEKSNVIINAIMDTRKAFAELLKEKGRFTLSEDGDPYTVNIPDDYGGTDEIVILQVYETNGYLYARYMLRDDYDDTDLDVPMEELLESSSVEDMQLSDLEWGYIDCTHLFNLFGQAIQKLC